MPPAARPLPLGRLRKPFGQLGKIVVAVVFAAVPLLVSFVAATVARYLRRNANLRTQLIRIIERAGLKPWPKLFQNVRPSRATELAAQFPAHVAAEWLGHSTLVAQKHYWRVTDDDFAKATAASEKALHEAGQSAGIGTIQESPGEPQDAENCEFSEEIASGEWAAQDSNL